MVVVCGALLNEECRRHKILPNLHYPLGIGYCISNEKFLDTRFTFTLGNINSDQGRKLRPRCAAGAALQRCGDRDIFGYYINSGRGRYLRLWRTIGPVSHDCGDRHILRDYGHGHHTPSESAKRSNQYQVLNRQRDHRSDENRTDYRQADYHPECFSGTLTFSTSEGSFLFISGFDIRSNSPAESILSKQ